MIFSEVYGSYFKAVSAILAKAVAGNLTQQELTRTVLETAFGESLITIPAKLTDGSWPLLTKDFATPLQHTPRAPLTRLEKQWLKALLLDPRVRLFSPRRRAWRMWSPSSPRISSCTSTAIRTGTISPIRSTSSIFS